MAQHRIALVDGGEVCFRIAAGSQISRWFIYPTDAESEEDWMEVYKYNKDAVKWMQEYSDGFDRKKKTSDDYILVQKITPLSERSVIQNTDSFLRTIKHKTKSDEVIVVFGHPDGNNFRDDLATIRDYKTGRGPRPFHHATVKNYCLEDKQTYTSTGHDFEDDDVLAILHNEWTDKDTEAVICSHDKDMLQVPGLHYHTDKQVVFTVSEVEGLRSFYKQLYTGDGTDTIPGFKEVTGVNKDLKGVLPHIDALVGEEAMYDYVFEKYLAALQAGCKNRYCSPPSDLDCILWEIGNLLYLRRSWDDEGWQMPYSD